MPDHKKTDDGKQNLSDDLHNQLLLYRTSDIGGVYSVRIDPQFTLLYGNDLFFQIHEYEPEALLGKSCTLFIHPQDLFHVQDVLALAKRHHEKRAEWEMRIITGKGNLKHVLVNGNFNVRNGEKVFDGHITDITKFKEIEQRLQESEEKFLIATSNSDVTFWTYYFDRKEIWQTTASRRVHGYDDVVRNVPESLIKDEYIRSDCVDPFLKMFRDLANGAKTASGEFWTRDHSRTGWWCEHITYTTVFDENGKPVRAHAIGRDITSEKLAENRYGEEISYKNIITTPNFIGGIRADLTTGMVEEIISSNKVFNQTYQGKNYQEYIDILTSLIIDDKQKQSFAPYTQREFLINEFKKGNWQKDFKIQRKAIDCDNYIWSSITIKLLKKPNSDHIIAFLYSHDINHEEIFRLAVDKITHNNYDLIGCIDGLKETYTMFSNTSGTPEPALQNYERAMALFLKERITDTSLLEKISLSTILKELENKDIYNQEFVLTDNGIAQNKQLRFSYIDKKTKTILFTKSDFTDIFNKEKAHQEALHSALVAAEKANSAKSEFLSRVSHDMRTPMNGIIGLTALTLDRTDLSDEVRQNLSAIDSSSKYLLNLINDTLDMSKIESGKLTLNPEIFHSETLVNNITTFIMPSIREKQIDFSVQHVNAGFKYIRADRIRLQQIFVNILSNAIKFTPSGGKIEWIFECLKQDEHFTCDRIIIRDNGIGISADFLPRLFEPFTQEENTASSHYSGTGLGMSIVKNLVEKMRGTIEVQSQKHVGTDVIITLNFENVSEADMKKNITRQNRIDLRNRHTLLCDDHPLNIEIGKQLLEKKGIIVDTASNGKEALDLFLKSAAHHYDVILMDIRMPVMDGLETTRAIRAAARQDAKAIPIIAMTANALDEDMKKSKEAGMNDHLAKPIDPPVLYNTLFEWINDSNAASG